MEFIQLLENHRVILTEGSVYDRLRREAGKYFDPFLQHLGLVYHPIGSQVLHKIYREYVEVGQRYHLPILIFTPTWRANRQNIRQSQFKDYDVNADGAQFLIALRKQFSEPTAEIVIGGLVGCRGDCYKPAEALQRSDAYKFHAFQIERLARANVDFLIASTLSALSEAEGIALRMAVTGLPYIVSFVLHRDGTLLDGTRLHKAVQTIDRAIRPQPTGYMINCVYPSHCEEILELELRHMPELRCRILGMQGNTSKRDPMEFDNLQELDSEQPEVFARAIAQLQRRFGMKILGGCCGTNTQHIEAIADVLTNDYFCSTSRNLQS